MFAKSGEHLVRCFLNIRNRDAVWPARQPPAAERERCKTFYADLLIMPIHDSKYLQYLKVMAETSV